VRTVIWTEVASRRNLKILFNFPEEMKKKKAKKFKIIIQAEKPIWEIDMR
jgi:hypothetical protein